jgi:Kef-type K+ transport system membrane component KefB
VDVDFGSVMGVLVVAVTAPLLSAAIPRVAIPSIVVEFVLGVAIGPAGLGWVRVDASLDVLSLMALGFLLFTAGTEVELATLRGPLLVRALVAYGLSLLLGAVAGVVLHQAHVILTPAFVAIVLSATGLGVVIPILRGAELTDTTTGQTILIVATVAEFSAVALLSLFFGEKGAGLATNLAVMAGFVVVAGLLWLALRWADRHPRLAPHLRRLEGGTVQIRIRLALLVLFVFLVLAHDFGLESILGAFAAGIVLGDLRRADRHDPASSFWPKLDALGFGFLIPLYFVTSGVRFDLDRLLGDPAALLRVPLFLVLFLLVRGVPALVYRRSLGPPATAALALLSATSLSFVITASDIGVRIGRLRDVNATALVGAAVLAMTVFPLVAQGLLARSAPRRQETFEVP